jgi:predicted permease
MNPMGWMMRRVRAVFGRRALEQDMQDEMRTHLEQATERYMARGMSASDARLAARREFGNLTVLQEESRDVRGARWVDALGGDMRFALRYFVRHKTTTAIIVAVLALSTGANTLIFSMLQAYFIRPAPGVPPDRAHVRIWGQERATQAGRWEPRGFSLGEMNALAERRDVFRDVASWTEDEVILDGGDSTGARGVGTQFVTPNLFSMLGLQLAAGRSFRADDGTPDMSTVLAYATAEQLFGDALSAVGRRIVVNQLPVQVIGVAPPRFQGALRNMGEPALWLPVSARATIDRISPRWAADGPALSLIARIAPGVSHERATAFARQIVTSALPDSATRVGMSRTADVIGLQAPPPGPGTEELIMVASLMMGIGILILLVAWMNVSSLIVAAAVGRRHEIAVRLSLGATRFRLLRQLVTESAMLAMAGAAIGLTLAWWILAYIAKVEVHEVDLTPDKWTFLFVLVMALTTGVLFGLSPALHATRAALADALRASGTGTSNRSRLQRGFVIAQIALSQPLLVLLGTMLTLVISEYRPLAPEMSRQVITATFRPLTHDGPAAQRPDAVDSLVPRIAERPEVLSAVQEATAFELRGVTVTDRLTKNSATDTVPTIVHLEGAAPGWFGVVGVPILLGRDVSLTDTAATDYPVVIGSDLARRLWGSTNPVGRKLPSPGLRDLHQDSLMMTVVGVYDATQRLPGMTWNGGVARGDAPIRVYTARGKHWEHERILVRTRGPAAPFVTELRKFLRAKAPALPVKSVMTLAQVNEHEYESAIHDAGLVGAGGVLALLLASLGLFGVVSLAVRQRTREIGIRLAIGANPGMVARMFVTSGVRAGLIALALGLPLSVAGLKIGMAKGIILAPEVNPYVIGAGIAVVLLAVAAAASFIPARQAAAIDPATTLRVE